MNEHLKFSWGHIIAFLAMIAIGYITFMGTTYATNGNFVIASVVMVAVLLVMMVIFIGPQYLKATDRRFKKRIVWERILVFAAPVIFCIAMLPYTHFWTVYAQDELVLDRFTQAINASKQMFTDYDEYAQQRVARYEHLLDSVKSTPAAAQYGITPGREAMQTTQMKRTLRLLLLSSNYVNLRNEALSWIESASQGASVWNVFLFGNTRQIKTSISDWNRMLSDNSAHILSNEQYNPLPTDSTLIVRPFSEAKNSVQNVVNGLDALTTTYTTRQLPNVPAIGTALLLFFMMLFPYLLQDRYDKSPYKLVGMKSWAHDGAHDIGVTSTRTASAGRATAAVETGDIVIDDMQSGAAAGGRRGDRRASQGNDGNRAAGPAGRGAADGDDFTEDDFGSFTL